MERKTLLWKTVLNVVFYLFYNVKSFLLGGLYRERKKNLIWRTVLNAVLGIRIQSQIRIRMFLGLTDSDSLVRGMDPDPDPSLFT
jgi:hypothetical protein